MSQHKKIVALDIGSHSIKFGIFHSPKLGHLTLTDFGEVDLETNPSHHQPRDAALTIALRKLITEHALKNEKNIAITLSSQAGFLRTIKLPPVPPAQIPQMVIYEAQQVIPFPLAEVSWDYQIAPARTGEWEAIIAAVKNEVIEADTQVLRACRLEVSAVELSPLSLYNAYRYNYGSHDHCALIIDLGAQGTNLIFIEGNSFFVRTVPIGGNAITQTISHDLQQTFENAEALKHTLGFVSLGGAYADPEDPRAARISKIIRSTMTKLHAEISRSISYYRTQQSGSAPQQIYLTGGCSRTPYLDVFLAEKLSLPVHYLNPLTNVTLTPHLSRETLLPQAYSMGPLVGLALRTTGRVPVEISLPSPSTRQILENRQRTPQLALATLIGCTIAGLIATNNIHQTSRAEAIITEVEAEVARLQAAERSISEFEKQYDLKEATFQQLARLSQQRRTWSHILQELNQRIPTGVWITQLTPTHNGTSLDPVLNGSRPIPANTVPLPKNKNTPTTPSNPNTDRKPKTPFDSNDSATIPHEINQLDIRGFFERGLTPQIINQFVTALAQSPHFNIDPQRITDAIVSTETPQGEQSLGFAFVLKVPLKNPIDLRP